MTDPSRYFAPNLLAGQVAVVTGGGSGIGYGISKALAGVGADVVITSRSAPRLAEAENAIAAETGRLCASLPCDVREEADVARLHDFVNDRYGPATIVVNNAAANFHTSADRMTLRALRAVLEADLIGTFLVTRQFLPDLIACGSGVVLSVGVSSMERGFPGYSHAGAAKNAISSLTSSWASEWGHYGIRVNLVAPGPVPTAGAAMNMLGREAEDAFAEQKAFVPLGRLGTPDDVAATAVFLCSPAASWITGASVTVDGGLNINPPLLPPQIPAPGQMEAVTR